MRIPLLLFALIAPLVAASGCEDKKPASASAKADANVTTDKYATADPKLEKALKAAASASAAASQGGPPLTGILEPGVADQKHPKGAPTSVELSNDGADPKVSLAAAADASADAARASSYGPAMMEVGMEMGARTALPTVDFALLLGPAKKDGGGTEWLVAETKRATPARQQLAALPPGLEKEIASLEGTQMRVKLTADGRESELIMQLGKSANTELDRIAQNAAEALVFATVPLPPKPVGVGGQWIAETRMPLAGVDVIAYRAYKVKSIDGDRIHLALEVKAYAASRDVQIGGVPKGATFEQFEAQGQGELELVRGETLARKSDVQQRVVLVFLGPGGMQPPQQPGQPPGNMLTAQIGEQATFVRGEDLRAAMRQ
jgi:hypothetical protein